MKKGRWLALLGIPGVLLALVMVSRAGSAGPDTTQELTITAKAFNYTPAVIRVNQGDRIKVTLKAEDASHGFYLDGYDVNIVARPREDAHAEFVADKVGKFRFRCSETCGPLHPFMIGELIVEPNSPRTVSLALAALTTVGTLAYLGLRKEQ